jgi:glycosyltransferase involved in cell wall biosynthesis
MRLAIVTDTWPPQINGVVTTLTHTVQGLKHARHRVKVIHPGLFSRTIACPSYPQIRLAVAPGKKLRALLEEFRPQAIHAATEGPLGLACRNYCSRQGLPFSTSFTTRFDEYVNLRFPIPSRLVLSLMRWYHSRAARVMVATEQLRAELQSQGFERLVLWPRGVDTELFRPNPVSPLQGRRPYLLYVGRVAVEKNIEAFLGLETKGTKFVVGDGPDLDKLKRRFPGVIFCGARKGQDLAAHFAGADVFVFPSKTDTFGVVMLEAMACGVPVAAYPARGPIDIVDQGLTGYLASDLGLAVSKAQGCNPQACRDYALQFSWSRSTEMFLENLSPIDRNFKSDKDGAHLAAPAKV